MTPYYLKFNDEAEALSVLYTTVLEVQDEEGNVIVQASVTPNYVNISTIGTIYEPMPDPLPEPAPEPVPYEGWHVNVLAEESPELTVYQVFPVVPMRIWG
jgi:hypothetical protein